MYGCHPAPIRPTQRPTGQTGLESWGDSMTEKNNSSLLQHRKARQVAESMTGQRPVSFSALRPLAAKWVRASARNCVRRIAGRDACPTRGWVKPASLVMRVTASQVRSALREQHFGVIPRPFHPLENPQNGPNSSEAAEWGRDSAPPQMGHTATHRRSRWGLSLPQEVGHPLAFRCQLQLRQLAVIVLVNCLSDRPEGKQQISIALFLLSW